MKAMPSQRGFYDIWVTKFWINNKWQIAIGFTETYWSVSEECWQYHRKVAIPIKTQKIGFEFSDRLIRLLGKQNVRGYISYEDEYKFNPYSTEELINIFRLVFDSFPARTFSKKNI